MKQLSQRITRILASAAVALGMLSPLAVPALAGAQPSGSGADVQANLCAGASLDANAQGDCATSGAEANTKINDTIRFVINLFSIVVGVVAVIMIIIGGFKYITSGGDSGNITGAKNTILYAIIGLVIVALAQFIVKFVLGKATGLA
ncbi:MAG: pilin [bacterium]|nr:pilin [bacterium]